MRLRYPLLKATYEWLLDEGLTPYFLINANFPKVMVPREFVEDGEIVLDASPDAIDDMVFDPEGISFSAGFDDSEFRIYFPIGAIIALYAEENEQGLFTTDEPSTLLVQESDAPLSAEPEKKESSAKIRRGQLKLVK
jgi:stringent starvation protein B